MAAATQSNRFVWNEYKAPVWLVDADDSVVTPDDDNHPSLQQDEEKGHSFTLRHLKQGATGAVRTWPVAEVLLDYLVTHGGILSMQMDENDVLDLTKAPPELRGIMQEDQPPSFNILELGAGSGYLGIGLALSLNARAPSNHHVARILCTDMDKATIKNMRHNLTASRMTKTVRAEPLCWGEESIGQSKFLQATKTFFASRTKTDASASPKSVTKKELLVRETNNDDPIRLVTHLIGSDVHYGETTLEPLSSVVAAVKLRNPSVKVILLNKERADNSIADLKARIEDKVKVDMQAQPNDELKDFSVRMRTVLHPEVTNMIILEC